MNPTLPPAVPEIPVSDIAAATAYYRDRLGFVVDWGGEELGLAGISRGECRIFLADPTYRKTHGNAGVAMTWLNLQSKEEVDELHRAWKAAGARLLSAPESKSWGLHEFVAADPDGNLLRVFYDFATPERAGRG
jgi:uncharacterized glyoxalase superfamily protein PhnB